MVVINFKPKKHFVADQIEFIPCLDFMAVPYEIAGYKISTQGNPPFYMTFEGKEKHERLMIVKRPVFYWKDSKRRIQVSTSKPPFVKVYKEDRRASKGREKEEKAQRKRLGL
jgi:hypothetical protein